MNDMPNCYMPNENDYVSFHDKNLSNKPLKSNSKKKVVSKSIKTLRMLVNGLSDTFVMPDFAIFLNDGSILLLYKEH